MSSFADKAKKIDMYASLPRLSFGKDGKVYSRFGLLLTFLTVVIIGGMAIWLGIKIFGRQKPAFIQYDLPPKEMNPMIPWNLDDFKFGLKLSEDDEDRLVRRDIQFFNIATGTQYALTEKKCQFNKLAPGEDFYCWEQKESTKDKTFLDVQGYWNFFFVYGFCSDPTKNCYTQADATTILLDNQASAALLFEDILVDPYNYENPISTTEGFSSNTVMFPGIGTTVIVELNQVEFESDNGWVFEDKKTITRLKPTITVKLSTTEMLSMQIKYGGTKTVYKRTYPKLQDFLAQLSGLITIITPIFLILVSPYGNLRAVQHMTNELYEIKLNKPQKDGDSPQKPLTKRKRRSSKSNSSPSKTDSVREVESDLLPKITMTHSKTKAQSMSTNRKATLQSPHAALLIGGLGKLPTTELPTPIINSTTLHSSTFDRSPGSLSPIKSTSKVSPHRDTNHLISPQKVPLGLAKALSPGEQKPESEKFNETFGVDVEERDEGVSDCETDVPLRTSDPLEVTWQTWLKSFWKPSPQVEVLKKAKEHITEAFDLVKLSKKVIEIDKLKACLFTHDQRVIFENLPSSVMVLNPDLDLKSPEAIKQYHWKESFKGDEMALRKAYMRLRETKSELDQLLIRLYESEFIDDGASL